VLIRGPLSQIVGRYIHQPRIARAPQNSTINRLAKELRKDRDDIEAQHLKDLQIQKPFGRIDDDCLSCRVDFNHDRICQRYQSFFAAVVGYHQNLGATSFKN